MFDIGDAGPDNAPYCMVWNSVRYGMDRVKYSPNVRFNSGSPYVIERIVVR